MRETVALFLLNGRNDYQAEMQRGAVLAARRRGLRIECHDGAARPDLQLEQITSVLRSPTSSRLLALLVHHSFDGLHENAAREAARNSIGWVVLNRAGGGYVDDLRRSYPDIPIFSVTPDQEEIGRAQARIVKALLPRGGKVLHIMGPLSAWSARQRRAGTEQELAGSGVEIIQTYGDWSTESGEQAIARWELLQGGAAAAFPDLVVAQNDAMALGARRALDEVAARRGWTKLARVPVTGCDGVLDFGVRLVKEKVLAATVVVPGTAAPAVDALDDWRRGQRPSSSQVLLPITIVPEPRTLAPLPTD